MSKKSNLIVCAVGAVIAIVVANYSHTLRTSAAGLALIGNAEGCRQTPYTCPAGVLTVGIGSTSAGGETIVRNKVYTLDEIAARWAKDVQQAEACVNRYGNGRAMPQGAFDAMTSITFNVGCSKMRHSSLFRIANEQGYRPTMCDQFLRWVYADGKKLNGLITRREQERALCLRNSAQ